MNQYINGLVFLLYILSVVELITTLLGFNHSTSSPASQLIVTDEQSDSETMQVSADPSTSICTDKKIYKNSEFRKIGINLC